MCFLDIILGLLLLYATYKGLKNGLFVEFASLISLVIGIFVAIKFSYLMRSFIENFVSWSPKMIEVISFGFTFLMVVIAIHALAKLFTSIADFAYLGWLNKLGGATFSVLKTVLMLSIVFNLFQKININNFIAKKETLDNSMFYNPIQEVSEFMYPSLNKLYNDIKTKSRKIDSEEKN
ncbi:CvpA family protein [Flavobacterium sp.]|uniref:CvpA family protein n=1 Tax=Flavobacterium sp. TaxID=239 RepID=UPI00286E4E05|nr:CvpA family protein [Flavobacterium sp.]